MWTASRRARPPNRRIRDRRGLQYRGQDHLLGDTVFVLGRDPACDLVFESELFPDGVGTTLRGASTAMYVLRDRSRHGTLVNDRLVTDQVAPALG